MQDVHKPSNNSVIVVCIVERTGRITQVDRGAFFQWGYKPVDLIGRRFASFILDADAKRAIDCFDSCAENRVARTASFECRWKRKDGSTINTLWSVQFDESKDVFTCISHDVTAHRQIEKSVQETAGLLRSLMKTLPIGVLILTESGAVEAFNPAAERLFGINVSELHIDSLLELESTNQTAGHLTDWMIKSIGNVERLKGIRSSGDSFPVEISVERFTPSEARQARQLLVVVSDITKKQELEKLKQEFFQMVSHDIRIPLTAIEILLTMLVEGLYGPLSDKGIARVRDVKQSLSRLLALINELLDVQKMESGKLALDRQTVNTSPLVQEAIAGVDALAVQKNVSIKLSADNLQLFADPERLVQVLVNLLGNAIKFSPVGGSILVTISQSASQHEFRVIDQGPGIPAEFLGKVFDRFQQVKRDSAVKGGTGLGLAICKWIVEEHGGSIGVESKEGHGSTFWFSIPMAIDATS